MASHGELYSFVRKFESLWKSGCNAKLHVETEAGHAFVNHQVGLGQALLHPQPGGPRGGGPSRERRREKRQAAIKAADEAVKIEKAVSEEHAASSETEIGASGNVTETEPFKIPQVDGVVDSDASYELQIETHDDCTEDEVIEALEANFHGTLSDQKEGDNKELYHLVIQNLNMESECEKDKRKLVNFKIAVKENVLATSITESWRERYNFDELAFRNYDYKNRNIRIDKVTRLWMVVSSSSSWFSSEPGSFSLEMVSPAKTNYFLLQYS